MSALVDSHLFRLDLAQWRALCSLFPTELQPIAEGAGFTEPCILRRGSAPLRTPRAGSTGYS